MSEQVKDADVVEGQAVEETGAELAEVAQPPASALTPLDTEEVVAGMRAYQELLPQLLSNSDYQEAGGNRRFVKKSGWRKIARAFGLSVEVRDIKVERDDEGNPVRAEVVARAIHPPTGQFQDGDGYCSSDEGRFGSHQGRQKLENDLRATATTRAKNRAIADLVGMGEVSAEEIAGGAEPYGPEVTKTLRKRANEAMRYIFEEDAKEVWKAVGQSTGDYLPAVVAHTVITLAEGVKTLRETEPVEGENNTDTDE